MRFKPKYKSCFWTKTDIWGNLLKKRGFLKPKWERLLGSLISKKRRRYQKLCKNYSLLKPSSRPNQPYKYPRWDFRNSLSNRLSLRRFYGDLSYTFFKKIAYRTKTINNFVQILESRLDITLYRLGFFSSIFESRQAVLHGKVLVNGKKIIFDHFLLKFGDIVEFCPSYRVILQNNILLRRKNIEYLFRLKVHPTPMWIQTDYSNLSFIVIGKINLTIFYPFYLELDEILCSSKYRY